jgi:glycerol-3-phosphate acyltransferase PlsY
LAFTHLRAEPHGAYWGIETGVALTDLTLFLLIVAIALLSARFWPIVMASMMGCGLFGHLTKPLGPDILPRAYFIAVAFWSYPELVLLLVVTWRHRMRIKRYGVDHAWVWQLPRRYREGWSVDELARPLPQN